MTIFDLIPNAGFQEMGAFIVGVILVVEAVKWTKKVDSNYIPAVAVIVSIAGALYLGVGWTAGVVAAVVASGLWDNITMVLKAVKSK